MRWEFAVKMQWNGADDEGKEVWLFNAAPHNGSDVTPTDIGEAVSKWIAYERSNEPKLGKLLAMEAKLVDEMLTAK